MIDEKRSAHYGTNVNTNEKPRDERVVICRVWHKMVRLWIRIKVSTQRAHGHQKNVLCGRILIEWIWYVGDMKFGPLLHFLHWNSILRITELQRWVGLNIQYYSIDTHSDIKSLFYYRSCFQTITLSVGFNVDITLQKPWQAFSLWGFAPDPCFALQIWLGIDAYALLIH